MDLGGGGGGGRADGGRPGAGRSGGPARVPHSVGEQGHTVRGREPQGEDEQKKGLEIQYKPDICKVTGCKGSKMGEWNAYN